MRLILVLLLWLVCSIAQADKREDLRQAIFGQTTNPPTMPEVEVVASTPLNISATTKRKLAITTAGLQNYCYDFEPSDSDGTKLAIVWQGHTDTLGEIGVAETAQALVDRGVRVIVGGMPGKSGNQGSGDHNTYTSLRPFIEPVTACLNYASAQDPDTQTVLMTGISGGGWTTTVAAAIDTRIDVSIPVSGSLPNHLRSPGSLGDYEQTEIAKTLSYSGLYALGASGQSRKQIQILNPNDSCCFALAGDSGSYGSNYHATIVSPVDAVASTIGGRFQFAEDTTIPGEHKISQWAIDTHIAAVFGPPPATSGGGMSITFDRSVSDNFERLAAVDTAAPVSLSAWVYPTSDNIMVPVSICASSNGEHYFMITLLSSGFSSGVRAQCQAGVTGANAVTTSGWTINQWNHVVAVFASATDRRAFVNGGNKGTNTTSVTPASLNRTFVGCSSTGAATFAKGNFFDGKISRVTVWNATLTDQNVSDIYDLGRSGDPTTVVASPVFDWNTAADETAGSASSVAPVFGPSLVRR